MQLYEAMEEHMAQMKGSSAEAEEMKRKKLGEGKGEKGVRFDGAAFRKAMAFRVQDGVSVDQGGPYRHFLSSLAEEWWGSSVNAGLPLFAPANAQYGVVAEGEGGEAGGVETAIGALCEISDINFKRTQRRQK